MLSQFSQILELRIRFDVSTAFSPVIVLFEFFDFNENNYLEEVELQFLFQSCIQGVSKTFNFQNEEAKDETFKYICKFIL